MIEILETKIILDQNGNESGRSATINVDGYLWHVGGLPLEGDLQPLLDANEAEYLRRAQAAGVTLDVFEVAERRVLKAFALLVMDEINILRTNLGGLPLPERTEAQIRTGLKNKLKSL